MARSFDLYVDGLTPADYEREFGDPTMSELWAEYYAAHPVEFMSDAAYYLAGADPEVTDPPAGDCPAVPDDPPGGPPPAADPDDDDGRIPF